MSDALALVAAIRSAPDDDAPRLVYADWLDEHGQPERAEFIRVQCGLARTETPALLKRETELLAAHHDAFAGPLAAPGLRFRFRRGFIVGFGHTGVFYSDDPGTRSRATSLLYFHPDGRAWFETTTNLPEAWAFWTVHGRNRPGGPTAGCYLLDALVHPARLRLTCNAVEGAIEFRGTMDGATLDLRVQSRLTGRRFRQRFRHVHVPDQRPAEG
jgi:uncharacterized protein (TIGR02996 family)